MAFYKHGSRITVEVVVSLSGRSQFSQCFTGTVSICVFADLLPSAHSLEPFAPSSRERRLARLVGRRWCVLHKSTALFLVLANSLRLSHRANDLVEHIASQIGAKFPSGFLELLGLGLVLGLRDSLLLFALFCHGAPQ